MVKVYSNAPRPLMGLRYGKDGTATVARRGPRHPFPKTRLIACLLVKLSWHLGGLNFPPVIDEDVLEHALSIAFSQRPVVPPTSPCGVVSPFRAAESQSELPKTDR